MRERADSAANFADRDSLSRRLKSSAVAPHLVVPERECEAERSRLCVNAMRAPNLRRSFELEGAAF